MFEINFSDPLVLKSGYRLPSRVLLSPMEGLTTPAFIQAVSMLHLVDFWMTPFISVTGGAIPSNAVLKRRLSPFLESGLPLIVQLSGRDAPILSECAVRLEHLGIQAVNLNLACPSPTVTGNGAGGALLRNPDNVHDIVKTVRASLSDSISLSVKLRAGYEQPNVKTLIQAVEDAEWIVFHFRTVNEMYDPVSDGFSRLREAVKESAVPVFGNGDVDSVESAVQMCEFSGCSGVALARAFMKNPSLPARISGRNPGVSASEMLSAMSRFGAPRPPLLEFARRAFSEAGFRAYLTDFSKESVGK